MALVDKSTQLRVAVLVFDNVEDIDFVGPMEVFTQSGAQQFTVAAGMNPIRTVAGLKLQPDYDFANAPAADVVLIPGDEQHWTVAGHLEMPMSAHDFFADSTKNMQQEGWALAQSAKLQRQFVKRAPDGQDWQLKLNLAAQNKTPSHYHVTISVEKKPATP